MRNLGQCVSMPVKLFFNQTLGSEKRDMFNEFLLNLWPGDLPPNRGSPRHPQRYRRSSIVNRALKGRHGRSEITPRNLDGHVPHGGPLRDPIGH